MSSRRHSHEGVDPLDHIPYPQDDTDQCSVRAPSLLPMSAEQFRVIRADFVLKLRQWRRGQASQKTPTQIAEILEYMADDVDHFKTAATGDTGICFSPKCDLIKHELLKLIQQLQGASSIDRETTEIMAYIGAAIGRLTLDGRSRIHNVKDLEAATSTLIFHRNHKLHVWDMPECGFGPDAEQLRVKLWTVYTNVNFSRGGCGCFQCRTAWTG